MHWKEVESDVRFRTVAEMVHALDCASALGVLVNLLHGVRIYASRSCLESVITHLRSRKTELGGLLLGRVYQLHTREEDASNTLIVLSRSLPSVECHSSSASLRMDAEVWCLVPEPSLAGEIVVGWYHSHPNLGAFFSAIDRRTQQCLFNHHYSLGLVVDPFQGEQKVFVGADCAEYRHDIIIVDHAEVGIQEGPTSIANISNCSGSGAAR